MGYDRNDSWMTCGERDDWAAQHGGRSPLEEIERLRAALQRIIDDKNLNHSSNWCVAVAREALGL